MVKSWNERYVILDNGMLKYYKSKQPKHMLSPQGILNFDSYKYDINWVDK